MDLNHGPLRCERSALPLSYAREKYNALPARLRLSLPGNRLTAQAGWQTGVAMAGRPLSYGSKIYRTTRLAPAPPDRGESTQVFASRGGPLSYGSNGFSIVPNYWII